MPTVTDRLATVEAAVRSITSGGSVSTIVIEGGDTSGLEAMDDQQNARLANAEAGVASLGSTVATQAATIANQAVMIAELQADLADALARITALETEANTELAYPETATATGAAEHATVSTLPSSASANAGIATATGAASDASVAGPAEGASTTYLLPFRLAT